MHFQILAAFSVFCFISDCETKLTSNDLRQIRNLKRSSGLLHEIVDLMVEQKLERINFGKNLTKYEISLETTRKEFKNLNAEIKNVKLAKLKLTNRIEYIKKQLVAEIGNLKQNLSDTKVQMSRNITAMMKTDKSLQIKYQQLLTKNIPKNTNAVATSAIGFTAYFEPKTLTNVAADSNILFNRVLYNEGQGLNVTDGKFYCPKNGVYLFSFTMESLTKYASFYIMKNEEYRGRFIKGTTEDVWGSGAATVVMPLVFGDRVWIKSDKAITVGSKTMFSGVLID